MSSQGYFYTPEDQEQIVALQRKQAYAKALLQGGMNDPGNAAYGGLANAGKSILGAILSNKADKAEGALAQSAAQKYAQDLGTFLGGTSGQAQTPPPPPQGGMQAAPPQVSNSAGSGPQMPPAMPQQPAPQQPAPQPQQQAPSPMQALIATHNPALMQQFGPTLMQHQLERQDQQADYTRNRADKLERPATPQEKAAAGLDPKTPAMVDAFGAVKPITDPNQLTAYQQAEIKNQQNTSGETARHNRVEEDISRNPFGSGLGAPGAGNLTGDAYLQSLPPGVAAQIKAVGTYRQPAPAGRTSPVGIKFMTMVNQAYPSYDASQYATKTKARNDFATGKNGNTVRSLNVAISHLDTLGQLSGALNNGDIPLANRIGQAWSQQTGSSAPTNFDSAKQIVGDEVVKAIIGTGGSQADREEAAKQISRASSPGQLAGVIQTYQRLLGGQLGGLKQQYEKTTGLQDFEDYLSPEVRSKLQNHSTTPAPTSRFKIEQVQ